MLTQIAASTILRRADGDNSSGIADYDDSYNSTAWKFGRWFLSIVFVLVFLSIIFMAVRANKKRINRGEAPIRGTSWLTPPSYRQSERQYSSSAGEYEDYVPTYTEQANENDLGYYDERGEFHLNGKSEYLPPPPLSEEIAGSDSSLERPAQARVRDSEPYHDPEMMRPSYTAQLRTNTPHVSN
ncbi:hypothetical protein KAFR_0F02560 [Kazachstania africana CBS 2517]|uniref:Uncharacterized protein n=1 Tax=Kazachstania africana (strain ATCC 22294 / BCRC 22015 / CBS 2517 / CECT 1963 / NBRC 1671 / NRRL Y-8276) TaxID=1071382 RepID=H2AWV3_KAZAF|nr:hypothetical protein KAFR_0F02560 [Kazachstania africana CBS 2517]CCF58853.1 hypothetical protein KAFR_0F02560 [Kazachstania africana CBS 2517]